MLPSPMNPIRAMEDSLFVARLEYNESRDISEKRPDFATRSIRATGDSLKRLDQISNQVGARGRVGHAGEWHAVARDHRLRLGDELVERLLAPRDAAALQRRRIA